MAQAKNTNEKAVGEPIAHGERPPAGSTTLDSHLDAPSITAPGDGPADTTDPTERASSATPDKGASALKGFGTVNAVVPLPKVEPVRSARGDGDGGRTEEYEATAPDGSRVRVWHNIDTGESRVIG